MAISFSTGRVGTPVNPAEIQPAEATPVASPLAQRSPPRSPLNSRISTAQGILPSRGLPPNAPHLADSSQPALRLQELPYDVLASIGKYVAPRDGFALSHTSGTLRQAVCESAQVHLAETLGNIHPPQRQEVCDHLLDTLSTVPVSRRHTPLVPLARQFDKIP